MSVQQKSAGRRVALLGGDGIGPEVVEACVPALRQLVPDVELIELQVGFGCFESTGEALPESTVAAGGASKAIRPLRQLSPPSQQPGCWPGQHRHVDRAREHGRNVRRAGTD